jgi:hypothetical protein
LYFRAVRLYRSGAFAIPHPVCFSVGGWRHSGRFHTQCRMA